MTNQEILEQDPKFFDRADVHIHLSNSQIEGVNHGLCRAAKLGFAVGWLKNERADGKAELFRSARVANLIPL